MAYPPCSSDSFDSFYPPDPVYPPSVHATTRDPSWRFFKQVAGEDGEIDAEELQDCLTKSGFHDTYTPFSLETCRIMIAMLDRDKSWKMGFSEFKELFVVLKAWKKNFEKFDRDNSGSIEPREMSKAIKAMGYRISRETLDCIIQRYSKDDSIYFDDYVACCIKLRTMCEAFKKRDTLERGSVTFKFDEFIKCTMSI